MIVTIRKIFVFLGVFTLVSTSLLAWSVFDLRKQSSIAEQIEHDRFTMIEKAGELRLSTDMLTKYARLYVTTKDLRYKNYYFNILDIRNGVAKKPANYNLIYWEIPEPIRSIRHPLTEPSSLMSEMRQLPYLPYEFDRLEEAESKSNHLTQLEIEAFNLLEGLSKDADGQYLVKITPNQMLAVKLLNSNEYQLAKQKIIQPIDDFMHSLRERIEKAISEQKEIVSRAFLIVFVLLTLSLISGIFTALVISRRVLSPIQYLTSVIKSFKKGTINLEEKIFFPDEIGLMSKNFFDMKKMMDDDIKRLDLALSAGNQGWFDFNPKAGKFLVSNEYAKILGYSANEFETNMETWTQTVHPDDLNSIKVKFKESTESKKPFEGEYRRKNKQGNWIWIHFIAEIVEWDSDNNPTRIVGVNADVSDKKQNEFVENTRSWVMELLVKTAPLSEILQAILRILEEDTNGLEGSIFLFDKDKKKLLCSSTSNLAEFYNQSLNGLEIDELSNNDQIVPFSEKTSVVKDVQKHTYGKDYKKLAAKANLTSCWNHPIIGSDDHLIGTLVIYNKLPTTSCKGCLKLIESTCQLAAVAIEKSQNDQQLLLASHVFKDSREGITITDSDGKIVDVNPAFCNVTGYSREEVIGENPSILKSGKQSDEFYADMWKSIHEDDYWQGEVWNRKKNGELYAELLSISALKNDKGETLHYIALFSDITNAKRQQEKLNLMAHYDLLTQLPNRALFTDRFHQAVAHSKRTNTQLAVCFIDLDNFKIVNDKHGHQVGDQLLVEVAKRIKSCIRQEDTVSRQGGDEFALLLSNIESYEQCELTLERIHDELAQPYYIGDIHHKISASSGITLYPQDNGEIDTLLRHADKAMYQAKLAGKHRYKFFNTEQDQQVMHKHSKLDEIQQALDNQELQLYYQPKVSMRTGEIYGAEALIRWIHPHKGLIPPMEFLPFIEGTPLEIKIGNWVINQALSQLSEWMAQGIQIEVSVNISSQHLISSRFIQDLSIALSKHTNIEPHVLELEVLESSALGDLKAIGEIINTCRYTLGVNVALDDFGTGYSSLAHLRNLSANTIKIDQSFVRDMLEDPSDYSIIEGVIGLSSSFGRKIIAEGVETTEQGLILMLMGCDSAQGYGIARPMPSSEFPDWIRSYKPNERWIVSGKRKLSSKQKKLKVFKLTNIHWVKQFKNNIKSDLGDINYWPIAEKNKCPCGTWIKRAYKEGYFNDNWLKALNKKHQKFHLIADEIKDQYLNNDVEVARKEMDKFDQSFEDLSLFINESWNQFS